MAYLLGKRERVLDGVRRVVIEELNAAAKSLRESHPSCVRVNAHSRFMEARQRRPAAAASRRAGVAYRKTRI
jgi:hypothetical protein